MNQNMQNQILLRGHENHSYVVNCQCLLMSLETESFPFLLLMSIKIILLCGEFLRIKKNVSFMP